MNRQNTIPVSWNIEDIQIIDPRLSDDEAREVLFDVLKYHDTNVGINWEVIAKHVRMFKNGRKKRNE